MSVHQFHAKWCPFFLPIPVSARRYNIQGDELAEQRRLAAEYQQVISCILDSMTQFQVSCEGHCAKLGPMQIDLLLKSVGNFGEAATGWS